METQPPPPPTACTDPLELELPDGSCVRPGIEPDGCAPGFVHDGEYGCEPILPAEPCNSGLMAVPGESTCRPVMECARGRWGAIPIDGTTEHVDGSYAGGQSDGSEARPWTTLSEAIAAAGAGAIVAVAAGSYAGDVIIDKPVRLWGVCPDRVEIVGASEVENACVRAALCVGPGGDGTEVRGVSLSGNGYGFAVSGATGVLLEAVRVHDAIERGIRASLDLGPASLTVRGSLVEQNQRVGVMASGAELHIEASMIRGTLPDPVDMSFGIGLHVQDWCDDSGGALVCHPELGSQALIRGSLVEQNRAWGVTIIGSDASIEASVVRDTLPQESDQQAGNGVYLAASCLETATGPVCEPVGRSALDITGSVIDRNHSSGVNIAAGDVHVESSVVRRTASTAADGSDGRGLLIQPHCALTPEGGWCDERTKSNATVRHSLIQENHHVGIFVGGSDATIETTVVRSTSPQAANQETGSGTGIAVSTACVGLAANQRCNPAARGNLQLRASLVAANHYVACHIAGADASLEASVVRATAARPADGLFGDGIGAISELIESGAPPTVVNIANTRIEDSVRAGIGNFGAVLALRSTHIQCSAFDLAAEDKGAQSFVFDDQGGNLCGCPTASTTCKLVSAGLEPPPPP